MLREILQMILRELDNKSNRGSKIEDRIVHIVDEIGELEIKQAKALAEVERWGDITDTSDWRTVEYNRIGRVIESKKRMLDTLKRDF